MKQTTIFVNMLVVCSFYVTVHAELLIVQKTEEGQFIPLPEATGMNDDIRSILERYQWPQCIINSADMSEQEKTDLLSPGKPHAEERFIQNKLQQDGKPYQVIFVPTTLYELFCIHILKTKSENNPLREALKKMRTKPYQIYLGPLINKQDYFTNIMNSIYRKYNEINGLFFADGSWGYVNNQFAQFLFSHYPELQGEQDAFTVSKTIKNKTKDLVKLLIKQFPLENERYDYERLLNNVIDLEYEARESNNALLLRGSQFIRSRVKFSTVPKRKILIGSTAIEKSLGSLEKQYKTKQIIPYSISFANSLFAGFFQDRSACTYYYLTGRRPTAGYVLFIDKKAYVEHRINNLFFISPLTSLAALFEKGEYFHSRTTATIPLKGENDLKNKKTYEIDGLGEELTDPSGVLLITRDPLRHAELFSNYLAQHGRILQEGSMDQLTAEEQKFAQEVLESQKEAAQFYKTTRRFKKVVDKKTKRIRARKSKAPLVEPAEQRASPDAQEAGVKAEQEVKEEHGL